MRPLLAAVLLTLTSAPALAHSLWVSPLEGPGNRQVPAAWINDEPTPARPSLLNRLGDGLQVWATSAAGEKQLKLKRDVHGDVGRLVDAAATADVIRLEAFCDNGVRAARPESEDQRSFRMLYYAKYLDSGASSFKDYFRAAHLAMDFVPTLHDGRPALQLLHNGQPVAGADVWVQTPTGTTQQLKTDSAGIIIPQVDGAGRYSFRSRIEDEAPGDLNGKRYEKTTHRVTFIVDVPEGAHILSTTR